MNYSSYLLIDYGLPLLGVLITALAQLFINRSYNKYRLVETKKKMTGAEVARAILDANGLNNVNVRKVSGKLTDHYDPKYKVIKLSREIYEGDSIASVSVAAHECGHAIQDKEGYFFLRLRSFIFPVVSLGTKFAYVVLVIGLLLETMNLITLGIALVGLGLLFQLVTLPTEINASKRAQNNLRECGYVDDIDGTKTMLVSAALTYVAGVLSSALEVIRLIKIFGDRD